MFGFRNKDKEGATGADPKDTSADQQQQQQPAWANTDAPKTTVSINDGSQADTVADYGSENGSSHASNGVANPAPPPPPHNDEASERGKIDNESDEEPFEHNWEPGDHVIRWEMLPIAYPIQIHGIVLATSNTYVKLADFGLTAVPDSDAASTESKQQEKDEVLLWKAAKPKSKKERLNVRILTTKKELNPWRKVNYNGNFLGLGGGKNAGDEEGGDGKSKGKSWISLPLFKKKTPQPAEDNNDGAGSDVAPASNPPQNSEAAAEPSKTQPTADPKQAANPQEDVSVAKDASDSSTTMQKEPDAAVSATDDPLDQSPLSASDDANANTINEEKAIGNKEPEEVKATEEPLVETKTASVDQSNEKVSPVGDTGGDGAAEPVAEASPDTAEASEPGPSKGEDDKIADCEAPAPSPTTEDAAESAINAKEISENTPPTSSSDAAPTSASDNEASADHGANPEVSSLPLSDSKPASSTSTATTTAAPASNGVGLLRGWDRKDDDHMLDIFDQAKEQQNKSVSSNKKRWLRKQADLIRESMRESGQDESSSSRPFSSFRWMGNNSAHSDQEAGDDEINTEKRQPFSKFWKRPSTTSNEQVEDDDGEEDDQNDDGPSKKYMNPAMANLLKKQSPQKKKTSPQKEKRPSTGSTSSNTTAASTATASTAPSSKPKLPKDDPTKLVLARARFLLEHGEAVLPPYNPFNSNSETIAVWCKTGHFSTIQADVFLHSTAIGNGKSATAVALGVAATSGLAAAGVAGLGVAAVIAPWWYLKHSKDKCGEATIALNDAFWSQAEPEVFVECIEKWSRIK